jgi:hypothetical protein
MPSANSCCDGLNGFLPNCSVRNRPPRDLVTEKASLGAAWELPVSNRQDLVNNRLTVDMQLRYRSPIRRDAGRSPERPASRLVVHCS